MILFKKVPQLDHANKRIETYVLEWEPQSRKVTLTEKEAKEVVEKLTKLLKK